MTDLEMHWCWQQDLLRQLTGRGPVSALGMRLLDPSVPVRALPPAKARAWLRKYRQFYENFDLSVLERKSWWRRLLDTVATV